MIRTKGYVAGFVLCVSLTTSFSSVWAGGAYLYELGTPDLGTAAAGRAAAAQDASTVVGNPAGMIRLDRSQLTASLFTILPTMDFEREAGTTVSGGNGFRPGTSIPSLGSASLPFPAGGLFYVYSPSDAWKVGVGLGSGYGSGLNYGKEWVGRYTIQKAQAISASLNPGVAFRVNDWLSVGVGFSVTYALLSQTTAVNNIGDQLPDGRLKFKADDWGFGGNAGILLELSPQTRLGLTYRSPIDLTFKDRIRFVNLGPGLRRALDTRIRNGTSLDQTLPQQVALSVYHQLTKKSALMVGFGWQNWKQFGEVDITIRSNTTRSFTSDAHFGDTWHGSIGAQYRLSKPWLFSAGFAYDSSAVSKFHRTPSLPFDRAFRYGLGLQYGWSDDVTIGVAYEFLDAGSAEIANSGSQLTGTVRGHYTTNYIHFVAMNLVKKF
jgi:long-chain fatty acid transport protein